MDYQETFTIHAKDVIRFYFRVLCRSRIWMILGFGLAGALTTYLYGASGSLSGPILWGTMLLTFAVVAVGFLGASYLNIRRGVRKGAKKNGSSSYEQTVRINGFGVRVTANGKDGRVGFDKLVKVEETRDCFYLYLTRDNGWIIPKNQMANREADCAALRALFQTVIPQRQLHLRG